MRSRKNRIGAIVILTAFALIGRLVALAVSSPGEEYSQETGPSDVPQSASRQDQISLARRIQQQAEDSSNQFQFTFTIQEAELAVASLDEKEVVPPPPQGANSCYTAIYLPFAASGFCGEGCFEGWKKAESTPFGEEPHYWLFFTKNGRRQWMFPVAAAMRVTRPGWSVQQYRLLPPGSDGSSLVWVRRKNLPPSQMFLFEGLEDDLPASFEVVKEPIDISRIAWLVRG